MPWSNNVCTSFVRMRYWCLKFGLLAFVLLLASCSSVSSRIETAEAIASTGGLKQITVETSSFKLRGYARIRNTEAPLVVYLEGDGMAWFSRHHPSDNPTPRDPLALRLATIDQSENVLYLARPCQYIAWQDTTSPCDVEYWTQKRFAPEVINATNEAIDEVMQQYQLQDGVHLVGYSGGGAVAALVAKMRGDVLSLRTIAGYLDHVALNKERGVSPLTGSLDPMEEIQALRKLPQIHYSGSRDTVIPTWVAENFTKAQKNPYCADLIVEDTSHHSGWENVWKQAWKQVPLICDF